MLRKMCVKIYAGELTGRTLPISWTNLSIGEPIGTPSPVPCLFCRFLISGSCPDDLWTLRIRETTSARRFYLTNKCRGFLQAS